MVEYIGAFIVALLIPCNEGQIENCGPMKTRFIDEHEIAWPSRDKCHEYVKNTLIKEFNNIARERNWTVRYTVEACIEIESHPVAFDGDVVG